jgi:hypothetical protein
MSEFEELTTRALALPAKGRAELAELLIQSLEETDDKDLKAAWLVEIKKSELGPLSQSQPTKCFEKHVNTSDA